ncbi:MAG TPA: UvrD-helicase domain-containing protein [Thermoanaerobaculia bacterium]|jgi:ATP-dependent helicase/nuclease subunit A|nr:UvrD-helicase domain-containing protein [Thermoanaerobaculia bacterium]
MTGGDLRDLRQADRDARRAAQNRFDRPLVLQAGAGTGKTTTLIGRLLAWSLGKGWDLAVQRLSSRAIPGHREDTAPDRVAAEVLGRVVAITFTEAAAAEMAGRAARELAALAAGGEAPGWLDASVLPPPPERSTRARALLGTLDHLSVRTIHAFCRGLLADHPLEAGVHPDLTIDADGGLVEQVVRETVEDSLRQAYGDPGDTHVLALAARGFGPQEIVEALLDLLRESLPSAALERDPFGPEAARGFRERLREACQAVHRLIAFRVRGSRAKNAGAIEQGLRVLLGRLEEDGADLESLKEETAAALPENLVKHLHEWDRGRLNDTEAALFGNVRTELSAAAATLEQLLQHFACLDPVLLEHGRRALRPLLARVEEELRRRGIATFDFLLNGAESLLARHPEVRRQVRRRIDQLLVDEFQDTDRTQCEILRWIALEGSMDPAEHRPGLFLVGDPKQSIYGWRGADLSAYDDFVGLVREAGGEVMSLLENFRSVPAILEEVARVVEPVMRERPGVQPPFEPLLPCERRQKDPGFRRGERSWSPVEHWVSWRNGGERSAWRTLAADAARIEAAALAADVRSLHEDQGIAWKEIAVLLRSTGDLDLYLEELRRARVPFAVGRDKQYYRRREVIEAAALVRCVLDPGDHLALLTVLRSLMVGVPDAALIPLWNRQFPRRMTELRAPTAEALAGLRETIEGAARAVPRNVPGLDRVRGWEKNLLAAVESLAVLRRSFETEPADVFLERLRRLSLIEATEAARYLGPYRLANLDRFFRQLLAAIEDGGGDVTAILRALRKSVAESREAEEGRPKEGTEDAVQVLTIHGAKGLDFEHVYLLQLHKASMSDRLPRAEAGRLAEGFEYRLFGAPTLNFDLVEAGRREVESAERVRLLYVAMTRAKDRLVLAGVWPERTEPKTAEQARTHMELLLARADQPGLRALWEEAAATAEGNGNGDRPWTFPDPTGALWKLLALRPEGEIRLAAEPERPSLPGPEEISLVSTRLRAERARAWTRMARPFGGAASEEAHALLREQQAERLAGPARRQAVDRAAAMAAGGAIHRALEEWDLAADPRREMGRQRALLPAYLAALIEGDELGRALPVAESLLEILAGGPLLNRLRGLKDHVLARELPVLLPPGEGDRSPVGVVTGAIDLLYRDPQDGRIVVADYKTDEVETEEEIRTRTAVYAPQGSLYSRAVGEALELEQAPRFELWFLRAGRTVQVLEEK